VRNLTYPHSSYNQSSGPTSVVPETITKTIPFDYAFQFELKGKRRNKVQDVVEISMQGVFVAVAVGYSLVPDEKKTSRTFPPVIDQSTLPQSPLFVPFFNDEGELNGMLVAGMPGAEITILKPFGGSSGIEKTFGDPIVPNGIVTVAFVDATQSLPSGKTDLIKLGGDGTAIVNFPPTVSSGSILRVWDRTNNILSELFAFGVPGPIVLIAGAVPPSTPVIGPSSTTKKAPAAGDTNVSVYGSPNGTVNVFLLESATGKAIAASNTPITLEDKTGKPVSGKRTGIADVTLPGTKRLSPGDVLLVQDATQSPSAVPFSMFAVPRPRFSTITLGALAAGLESVGTDLSCGFRPNPNSASLLMADTPLDQLTPGTLDKVFESCCLGADEVSFLYSIDVVSTGRELQNKAIHNVAGLGIANGDRPFRPFAKPVAFAPRSSIRIQIEEISGPPGTLHIVLQGYKMLGTGRIPG
jgi:hypothetical protein